MAVKRFIPEATLRKTISPQTLLTIGAAVQQVSSAFDLGLDKKFSHATVIYAGHKAGTVGVLDVRMTVTTGPTNAAAGAFKAQTAAGTTLNTGHAPNSASEIMLVQDIDLMDMLCDRWIKVTIDATGSASDTVNGTMLLELFGAREEPLTSLSTNAMDTL